MIPHFQLPSLSFWRRRKNDVDLETLFIHSEKEKSTATEKERLAETSAAKDADFRKKQKAIVPQQEEAYRPAVRSAEKSAPFSEESPAVRSAEKSAPFSEESPAVRSAEKSESFLTYRPAEFAEKSLKTTAEYGKPDPDIRSRSGELRFFQTAGKEDVAFPGTGTAQTEENFSAENSSLLLQENSMPEKKSDTQLGAAISALTECARGQLRYLKKNYDLLKTQTEEHYFN